MCILITENCVTFASIKINTWEAYDTSDKAECVIRYDTIYNWCNSQCSCNKYIC